MTAPRAVPGEAGAVQVRALIEPGALRFGRRGRRREGEA
jgi:hypothetical protein